MKHLPRKLVGMKMRTKRRGSQQISLWRRELVDLTAVVLAVGTAHLVATSLGTFSYGPYVLIVAGLFLAAGMLAYRTRQHRRASLPNQHIPAAAPETDDQTPTVWRICTTVADEPGRLAAVCNRLAELDANVASLQVHPLGTSAVDEFLVTTPSEVSAERLVAAVSEAGGIDVRVEIADRHDLVDLPTWVLMLAARTAADTAVLPSALSAMFGGCEIRWTPPGTEPVDSDGRRTHERRDSVMRLSHPESGSLVISRPGLPFTPAEFARAQALVDLAERPAHHP